MNSLTPKDSLASLWQTAPRPDPQQLLEDLRRLKQMRTRLQWTVFGALSSVTALLAVAEATGHIATHGFLSAIWMVGLVIGGARQWRSRRDRLDALSLDTVTLLRRMLGRAKQDLLVARYLYAGVPVGAVAGALLTRGLSSDSVQVAGNAHLRQTVGFEVAGAILLGVMMMAGILLSRSRSLQVQELQEKLTSFEAEV